LRKRRAEVLLGEIDAAWFVGPIAESSGDVRVEVSDYGDADGMIGWLCEVDYESRRFPAVPRCRKERFFDHDSGKPG
jgi:hypothetical protein